MAVAKASPRRRGPRAARRVHRRHRSHPTGRRASFRGAVVPPSTYCPAGARTSAASVSTSGFGAPPVWVRRPAWRWLGAGRFAARSRFPLAFLSFRYRGIHECNRRYHRARSAGLARQSDGRVRRAAGVGRNGPCGSAVGRIDRLARSDRTARRRQVALSRQGCAEGSRAHQHRDFGSDHGPGRRRTGLPGQDPDRTRRHGQQVAPRRERHAGRVDGRGQGCC